MFKIAALLHTKIFVNEILSSAYYTNRYQVLKEAAKNFGFKYVWHYAGVVLVRRGERDRVHSVRSVSDLSAILAASGTGVSRVGSVPLIFLGRTHHPPRDRDRVVEAGLLN